MVVLLSFNPLKNLHKQAPEVIFTLLLNNSLDQKRYALIISVHEGGLACFFEILKNEKKKD